MNKVEKCKQWINKHQENFDEQNKKAKLIKIDLNKEKKLIENFKKTNKQFQKYQEESQDSFS